MLLVRDTIAWLRDDGPVVSGDVDEARVLQLAAERGDATSVAYAHAWRSCKAYLGGNYDERSGGSGGLPGALRRHRRPALRPVVPVL